ncbi:hypothetical protein DID75_02870 [Candidatus Marinamargulisbacteria bacterium SCGC AG-410-N11]|nr:hypothetical protein DID75_02870 [Candidatus Marinamargulisbacteria bacterium SCGC AG-410-N11]
MYFKLISGLSPKDIILDQLYQQVDQNMNKQVVALKTFLKSVSKKEAKSERPNKRRKITYKPKLVSTMIRDLRTWYQNANQLNDGGKIKAQSVYRYLASIFQSKQIRVRKTNTRISKSQFDDMMKPLFYEQAKLFLQVGSRLQQSGDISILFFKESSRLFDLIVDDIFLYNDSILNQMMTVHYNLAIQYLNLGENSNLPNSNRGYSFKMAKESCRKILKLVNRLLHDNEMVSSYDLFKLYKRQTWNIYHQVLQAEGEFLSNRLDTFKDQQLLRQWMILVDAHKYGIDQSEFLVSVNTKLGNLYYQLGISKQSRSRVNTYIKNVSSYELFFKYYKKNKQYLNDSKFMANAYKFARDSDFKLPSNVLSCLYRWFDNGKSLVSFTYEDAFLSASKALSQSKLLNNNRLIATFVNENLDRMQDKKSFFSNSYFRPKQFVNQEVVIYGHTLTCSRFYPPKPLPNVTFVKKLNYLQKFCKDRSISLVLPAQIDFSVLDFVAYDTDSFFPSIFNLMLWKFDDCVDEKYTSTMERNLFIKMLKDVRQTLAGIFNLNVSLNKQTIPVFQNQKLNELLIISEKVREMMLDHHSDYRYWDGFILRLFETFDAQIEQAIRKKENIILTPSEFDEARLVFSGVFACLELAVRLMGIKNPSITQNEFIQNLWVLVNLAISKDNCGDSVVKEFTKEHDTENNVFVEYVALMKAHGVNFEDGLDWFKHDNFDPILFQDAFQRNGHNVNDILFNISSLMSCIPLNGINLDSNSDFIICIEAGIKWVNALAWSKEAVRYFFSKDSQKFEQELIRYYNQKLN